VCTQSPGVLWQPPQEIGANHLSWRRSFELPAGQQASKAKPRAGRHRTTIFLSSILSISSHPISHQAASLASCIFLPTSSALSLSLSLSLSTCTKLMPAALALAFERALALPLPLPSPTTHIKLKQQTQILKDFPGELRGDVSLHLHREVLSLPIFASAPQGFLKSLARHIESKFCCPT